MSTTWATSCAARASIRRRCASGWPRPRRRPGCSAALPGLPRPTTPWRQRPRVSTLRRAGPAPCNRRLVFHSRASNMNHRKSPLPAPGAVALALAALLAGCASTPAPGTRSVTIERTTFGIAHITAPDYEGIAYGVGYAHAQDNVCQTAEHLLTVRGERSRFLGPEGMGEFGLGRMSNAQIDLFVRNYMDDALLDKAADTDPEVRAALRGYVAGY